MIIAAGDSFVWGNELSDCQGPKYSQLTFPAILAKSIDQNYKCIAWPGIGNEGIARSIIAECEQSDKQDIFILVTWSSPGRYEFRFRYDTKQKNSPWYTFDRWTFVDNLEDIKDDFINQDSAIFERQAITHNNAQTTGVAKFARLFYENIGDSEYWEVYTSLKEIVYLQNYLLANNIPFLFTCVDTSIFYNYTVDNADATIQSLLNQIDYDRWFLFPGDAKPEGFKHWAIKNKYPAGALHPLEQAHYDATQLIKEKFNELVKKNL